jgi:uncharacterized protein YodC (DUF2158 family)
MDFGIGDIVRLRTGGPKMVLEDLVGAGKENPKARCRWFNGKKACAEEFSLSSLDKLRPKKNKDKRPKDKGNDKRKK